MSASGANRTRDLFIVFFIVQVKCTTTMLRKLSYIDKNNIGISESLAVLQNMYFHWDLDPCRRHKQGALTY